MRVLVTGATGFIGGALVQRLLGAGHEVVAWVRRPAVARNVLGAKPHLIDTRDDEALRQEIEACDAVINLAGAPIFPGRWTKQRQQVLTSSRVDLTRRLVSAIAAASARPRTLVSASAVGFYGDRGNEPLTEESAQGSGFLAQLCADWEHAANEATELGVRVCTIRIGVVLGREGGALNQMLPPFMLGAGGRIGSGRQYMPWIHQHDLTELFVTALHDERYVGPINGTAPTPVTNAQFTAALAGAVRRPAIIPVPAAALKAIFGDASEILLGSQNPRPERAAELGFRHAFGQVEDALDEIINDTRGVRLSLAADVPDVEYLRARPARYVLEQQTWLDAPVDEVFDFFSQAENLGAMSPPTVGFDIQTPMPVQMGEGLVIDYRISIGPVPMRWRTRIARWSPGTMFADAQERGPYGSWWHEHHFEARDGGTMMTDRVYYSPPLGWIGRFANRLFVQPMLRKIFSYRSSRISMRFPGRSDRERKAA